MRSPLLALLLASSLPGADLIEANRDPAVSARQDFWTHANGAWLRRFPLAPDRAVYNSFAWQDDLIKKDLLVINGELLAKRDATADQRRLADFWRSALGFEAGPAELPAGLRAVLAKLDEAKTPQALLEAAADLYAEGTGTFLGVFAGQDKKDETKVALQLWQTGLSLPERAFYFSEEPATKRVRDAFPAHVAQMLGFLGYDAARARQAGAAVLAFETRLAEVSLPLVQLRNPDAHYHPMSWAEIDALTPGLRWEAVTRRAGAPAVTRVIVGQPDFLQALARILAETPAEAVRDYFRFQAISGHASVLNAATAAAAFEFEGVVLTGAKQQRSLPGAGLADTGWRPGRPTRQGIRGAPLHPGAARTFPPGLRERPDRLRRPHPQAGVDGCRDAGVGLTQTRRD